MTIDHNALVEQIALATKYPVPVRIAASLHLAGITYADFHEAAIQRDRKRPEYRLCDQVTLSHVDLALNDIEKGFTKMTRELRLLASQIDVSI